MKIAKGLLLMALLLLMAGSAAADVYQTYDLAWSGAPFNNSAWATGQITIDVTALPNPGGPAYDMYSDIESLTVTVMGAGLGNGTWNKDDLSRLNDFGVYTYWDTGGGALNLNAELVGQATMHGGPWGTPNSFSGDFNLFFTDGGPFGTYYFTLTTNGGYGDPMLLTEFAPVRLTSTPEAGTFVLVGIGILGLTGVLRRRLDL
jgi:hypothetical protein